MPKLRYHLNSFYFQKKLFEAELGDRFEFDFSPPYFEERLPAWKYVPLNAWHLHKLYHNGALQKYDVIHFNRPEAFWMFKYIPKQISVFEAHGYDVGIWAERYLIDITSAWKKRVGSLVDRLITPRIKQQIQLPDIWYCSTPDLVDPLTEWSGRKPEWLPNPIDVNLFSPDGSVAKLQGSPAVFLAARLHGDKKPEVAIKIFQEEIKPRFKDATLHFISSGEYVEKYKRELTDSSSYVWHPYMTKDELASKLRAADLVFGDFSIGALSMLPMQAMALRRPIVTYDRYEVGNKTLEELPSSAVKILEDAEFGKAWAQKAYQYVIEHHSPHAIATRHLANLRQVGYAKGIAIG